VNVPKLQTKALKNLIANEGRRVLDTIFIGENIRAFTVAVSAYNAIAFAEKFRANNFVRYVGV